MKTIEEVREILIDLSLDNNDKEEFFRLTGENWKEYVLQKANQLPIPTTKK